MKGERLCLKKTWRTAWFEPSEEDKKLLRSVHSPSVLPGPGFFDFVSLQKLNKVSIKQMFMHTIYYQVSTIAEAVERFYLPL